MPTNLANIPLEGLRAVLVDLDDTLYAYPPAHDYALRQAFAASGYAALEGFAAAYRQAREKVRARLSPQGACRSRLFAFQLMAEDAGLATPYQQAYKLDKIYWQAFIQAMRVDKAAQTFLLRCQQQGLPVCIVSDMLAQVQMEKIAALGIAPLITHLVTSEEVGAEKPDPRMFQTALAKLGCTAQQVLMLGDDQAKDIAGAVALGIQAYFYRAGSCSD